MTIENDLGPKLASIRALARERFAYDMRTSVGIELTDDDGFVIRGRRPGARVDELGEWQQQYRVLNDYIESICSKLRRYFQYDALDLTLIAGRLTSRAGAGPGGAISDSGTSSIVGRLTYASENYLQKVDRMLHAGFWQGDAADTFQSGVVDPLSKANGLQAGYAWGLALIVQTMHAGLEKLGADLKNIVNSCLEVLPPVSDGKAEVATELSYLSIAAGILSFFPPVALPAGAVSLTAGITGTYLSETNAGPPPRNPTVQIEGTTALQILESTWKALHGADAAMVQFDLTLSQVVGGSLDNPEAFGDPRLTVANPSAPWPRSTFPSGQPGQIDKNPLVVALRDLYHAGHTLLPGFAQECEAAAAICWKTQLDANLSDLYPMTVPEYAAARSRLDTILSDTSTTAAEVGEALVDTVDKYDLTDAESAELIRQTGELPDPVARDDEQESRPVRGAY